MPLRNCSLVAKSWVYPSGTRIFSRVDVLEETLKIVAGQDSPTINILQHVRSLLCYTDTPQPSPDILHNYLPSFRQHEFLSFFLRPLQSITQIGTFTTLSHLRLQYCTTTVSRLVTFVSYFPNLAHLDIVDPSLLPAVAKIDHRRVRR